MPSSLLQFFQLQHVKVQHVPPTQKRTNKAERAIQTFRRHFLSILVGTHANFPINQWHHLLPQTEWTLNMLHAWPDNMTVSAYHGLHRQPYDFISHPMAPCGILLVAHDPVREKWDNYRRIGFYLGPAVTHYRSYHCFITNTNATRICDSVMFYPAPLVLPGASRLDQPLQLTERLVIAAESKSPEPDTVPLYTECLQQLKNFLRRHTSLCPSPHPHATAPAPILALISSASRLPIAPKGDVKFSLRQHTPMKITLFGTPLNSHRPRTKTKPSSPKLVKYAHG
jgi:hypothetical protein